MRFAPPYVCTMNLRPFLRLGPRAALEEACAAVGIDDFEAQEAAGDAMAAGRLLQFYLRQLEARGVSTFRELLDGETPAFCDSWKRPPLCHADFEHLTHGKKRTKKAPPSREGAAGSRKGNRAFDWAGWSGLLVLH